MEVRDEKKGDEDAIRNVQCLAFGQGAEANLVDQLRTGKAAEISLVALIDEQIVGHVVYSRVGLAIGGNASLLGLGPMGVHPDFQGRGVGTALVEAGTKAAKSSSEDGIVLVGHPEYYPRFGFRPATEFGLSCEFPIPAELFMALELYEGALEPARGLVRYAPEFGKL